MLTFSNWTDEIAAISGSEEFQKATVRIWDPELIVKGEYDFETGAQEITDDGTVYEGRARVIPMRWNVNHEGSETANSSAWTAVLVQLPKGSLLRVNRGVRMQVTACEDNPSLLSYLFTVNSDLQGSNAASRTFEFAVDGDGVMPSG